MIAVRDPYGFRPLCYGKMPDGSYVIASESCALTSVGAELIRDLLPGEILVFSEEGVESRREHCGTQKQKTCIFEYIYLQDRTLSLIRSLYQQQEFRLGNY